MAIASLIMPGLFVGLGIGLVFQLLGVDADLVRLGAWRAAHLDACRTACLIMFAVLGRFNRAYEEAASDLGASSWQRLTHVTLPIVLPGIIGVALFGFTLSYDEFPRTRAHGRKQQYAAAGDLGDDDRRHLAGAVCGRHRDHGRFRSSSSAWR